MEEIDLINEFKDEIKETYRKKHTEEDRTELKKAIEEWKKPETNITQQRIEEVKKEQLLEQKQLFEQTFKNIVELLADYSDLKERDYHIIALWIIGTYFYKQFITFPYLFLNATKGSGKSRTLNLIVNLSWNGQLLGSMTEAGLFRSAGKGTLGLDEFEGIAKKENHGLREILNSGYKRGMKIIRMKKQKTINGEEQVPEYFEPYTPIVMANIWGMEDVLGDRCITAILEKSNKPLYILKMEDFDTNIMVQSIKNTLNLLKNTDLVSLCCYFGQISIYTEWNKWINHIYKYNNINNTNNTNNTNNITYTILPETEIFFKQMLETGLNGRDLELCFPLFLIANIISDDTLLKILEISKEITKEKKQDEMTQSRDVMLLEFISKCNNGFYKIKDLINMFREYIDYDERDEYSNWCNSKWLGRALRRLELKIDERRIGSGNQVTLNIYKAREKLKVFQ